MLNMTTNSEDMGYSVDSTTQLDFMEFFLYMLGLARVTDISKSHKFEELLCADMKAVLREMFGYKTKTYIQCKLCKTIEWLPDQDCDVFLQTLDYRWVRQKTNTDTDILVISKTLIQHIFTNMMRANLDKNDRFCNIS